MDYSSYSGTYIVLMRVDSVSTIYQETFEHYFQAKKFYDKMKANYHFVKLCKILEDSRDD